MNDHRRFGAIVFATFFFVLSAAAASATCPTFHQLQNGQSADATQVMDNFNYILNCPTITGNLVLNGDLTSSGPYGVANIYVDTLNSKQTGDPLEINHRTVAPTKICGSLGCGLTTAYFGTDGKVGIGTITPAYTLDVQGTVHITSDLVLDGNLTATGSYGVPNVYTDTVNSKQSGDPLELNYRVASPTKICGSVSCGITTAFFGTDGNVGIGTITPSAKLDVAGTTNSSGGYTQNSDIRLKTAIKPLNAGALDTILQLRPMTFQWIAPKDKGMKGVQIGLIAQDVEKLLPTAVTTADDAAKTKAIKYNELTVVLAKALQEEHAWVANALQQKQALADQQAQQIAALQRENKRLEQENLKLAGRLSKLERTHLARAQ